MVGMAVGLGNVWRFPYMMGSYGGSAFLIMYLVFTLMFALPALICEVGVGRNSGSTIVGFKHLFGQAPGRLIGYLLVGVVTIAGSYYAVVVANVFFSTFFSISQGFSETTIVAYQEQLSNGLIQYLVTALLIIGSLSICYLGLRRGIERISVFIMPFFIVAIIYLIVHAWTLPGTTDRVIEFLSPDFKSIGGSEVFAALGQAFFSIGLGGTFVLVYSSYLSSQQSTLKVAVWTSFGDLGSSFLVSLFLIPTILVLGMQLDAGPSLIFNTLPELFSEIPGGVIVGPVFLLSLSLVAFLSLIAAYQVPISTLNKEGIPLPRLIIIFGIIQLVLALPSSLYPEIIGILDMVFGSGMQVIGSLLVVVGVGWGINQLKYRQELKIHSFGIFWLRYVIPSMLLVVLITYLAGLIS